MGFKKILTTAAKVGDKAIEVAALVGAPGMKQLDGLVDAIQGSAALDHEKEAALNRIEFLKSLPVALESNDNPGLFDSKRVKMTLINVGVVVLVNILSNYGILQQSVADWVSTLTTSSIGLQVAMETVRPSGQARD